MILAVESRFNHFVKSPVPSLTRVGGTGHFPVKDEHSPPIHSPSSDLEILADTPGLPDGFSYLPIPAVGHRQHKRLDLFYVGFAVG